MSGPWGHFKEEDWPGRWEWLPVTGFALSTAEGDLVSYPASLGPGHQGKKISALVRAE